MTPRNIKFRINFTCVFKFFQILEKLKTHVKLILSQFTRLHAITYTTNNVCSQVVWHKEEQINVQTLSRN